MTDQGWQCASCGQPHEGLATVFGTDSPDLWANASEGERAGGELNDDLCTITLDGRRHFFIRGALELPVDDPRLESFTWSVWVSLSERSWETTLEHWDDPHRADLPAMFGWLSTALPYEKPTIAIGTHVHTREPGLCPLVELDPAADHPLVHEQAEGISLHRVAEINAHVMG